MSFSEQPSPYGGAAIGGLALVVAIRMMIHAVPGDTAIAILMPLASVAVMLALVHLARSRSDWRAKLCAGVMLGQALWEGLQVSLEGVPAYPATATVLVGVVLALALLWRPATWLLLLVMADAFGGLALNGWAASRTLVPPPGIVAVVVQALLHGICLALALSFYQAQRVERMLSLLEDEGFS